MEGKEHALLLLRTCLPLSLLPLYLMVVRLPLLVPLAASALKNLVVAVASCGKRGRRFQPQLCRFSACAGAAREDARNHLWLFLLLVVLVMLLVLLLVLLVLPLPCRCWGLLVLLASHPQNAKPIRRGGRRW